MAVYDSKYNGAELDDALDDALAHIQDKSNPHNVSKSQVGLGNVGNFKAVSTEANQNLTETEKSNARTNLGLGSMATKSSLTESDIPSIPKSKISDFPASMPASDVYAWAKASTKPTYTANEVGACDDDDSRLSDKRLPKNMFVRVIPILTDKSVSNINATYLPNMNVDLSSITFIYENADTEDHVVTVATTITVGEDSCTVHTPDGNPIELTCPAGGYCEVNFVRYLNDLYARGI